MMKPIRYLAIIVMVLGVGWFTSLLPTVDAQVPANPKIVRTPLISEPGKPGRELVDAGSPPATLNPMVEQGELLDLIHAGLVEINPLTQQVEPALAEAFSISTDKKEIKFTLRKVNFSDGRPLTVADVLFTVNDVLLNPELKILENQGPVRAQLLGLGLRGAAGASPSEVVLKMDQPVADAPGLLIALAQVKVLPKHKLADKIQRGNPQTFLGAWSLRSRPDEFATLGPFRVAEIRMDKIILARNPHYWKVDEKGTQLPYLDRFIRIFVKDGAEAVRRFHAGEVDLIEVHSEGDAVALAEKARLVVGVPVVRPTTFIAINQDIADPDLQALFRDVRFRKAVAHSLDRKAVFESRDNRFVAVRETFVHPLSPFFNNEANPKYEFNQGKAQSLLDQLGLKDSNNDGIREFPSGRAVSFELMTNVENEWRKAFGEQLKVNLTRLGIQANYRIVPFSELSRRFDLGARPPIARYEVIIVGFGRGEGSVAEPLYLADLFHSQGSIHIYRLSDATAKALSPMQKRIDEIFLLQQLAPPATRQNLLIELQRLLSDDLPLIPLLSMQFVVAIKTGLRIGNEEVIKSGYAQVVEYLWWE